jgi:hypothetical protein
MPAGAPVRTRPGSTAPVIHTLYHTIQSTMVVEPGGGSPRPWHTVVIKGLMTTRPVSKTGAGTNRKSGAGLTTLFSSYIDSQSNISICTMFALDCLRDGRSGDRIPVGTRFSAPVQTGPESHPASCTMGTGSFPGVRCGRGVTLTPHPLLVPRSKID